MQSSNVAILDAVKSSTVPTDTPVQKVETTAKGRVIQQHGETATVWDPETKSCVPYTPPVDPVPASNIARRIEADRIRRKQKLMAEYVGLLKEGKDASRIESLATELGRADQIAADSSLLNKVKRYEDLIRRAAESPVPEEWKDCDAKLEAYKLETQRIINERQAEERRLSQIVNEVGLDRSRREGWGKQIEIYRHGAPDLLASVPKHYTGFIDFRMHAPDNYK